MNACCVCGRPVPRGTACEDCLEGLREDHREALAEYRRNRPDDDLDVTDPDDATQGKRPDQVEFSAAVCMVAALIGSFVVGISLGIAIASITTPIP